MVRLAWLGSGGRGWEACLQGHTGPSAPGSTVCGFMGGGLWVSPAPPTSPSCAPLNSPLPCV